MIKQLVAVSLVVLAGCSAGPTGDAPNLSARLTAPTNIDLAWHVTDPAAAGQVVEYATEQNGQYTVLGYLPPTQTTYTHAELIPQTPFYYRVRPFYGTASAEVELALPPGEFDDTKPDEEEWVKPRTLPGAPAEKVAVRDVKGAPAEFTVTMVHANGVKFAWSDRTSDEEGFMLEIKPAGAQQFAVSGVLDPDVNAFGMVTLPNEKKATYRVRPYRFGDPTNTAHQTTGGEVE
ncbi:MAG: fibronectin type III domain-containing protein [Kibdelosporangium sp.]